MNILDYIPKGATCKRLFIVGPYPMSSYVEELQKNLRKTNRGKKCELVIYADESWSEDEIDKLKEIGAKVILVRSENPIGLVHAKMYFLECEKEHGKPAHVLIAGSGNATKNAMNNNAEVMTVAPLSLFKEDVRNEVKNYFEGFLEGNCSVVGELIVELKQNSDVLKLILPKLRKSSDKVKSFYSWLRSGYLFYEYAKDPNFGFITYNLKKPLKGNKAQLDLIKKNGFESSGGMLKTLRRKYLKKLKVEKKKIPNKLSKYAIETAYGYWVSKECFYEMQDMIFPNKQDFELRPLFNEVNEPKVIKELRDSVKKLSDNKNFSEYIDKKYNNRLGTLVERKIDRDRKMACDENFVDRYNTGFASHKMPNLDDADFEEFCDSFISTVLIKSKGSRKTNAFTKLLLKKLPHSKLDEFERGNKNLEKWLSDNWNVLYPEFREYYKNGIVLIKQLKDNDSGIACVAMLLGLPYKRVLEEAEKIWGDVDRSLGEKDVRTLINELKGPELGNYRRVGWSKVEGRNIIAVKKGDDLHWIVAESTDGQTIIYNPERKKGKEKPIENPDGRCYRIYKCLKVPTFA